MKTLIYTYKSGDKVVPIEIQKQIEKIIQRTDISIAKGKASDIRASILGELHKLGWSDEVRIDPTSNITITSIYQKIGLCVQFGNISRVYADLVKLQTLFLKGSIHSGIIIMPSNKAARILGDNITNSQRVLKELEIFSSVITMPLLIIDFDDQR